MVLFKPTFSGVGRLELHSLLDTDASHRKRRVMEAKALEKIVVRLRDCLSAATDPEEPCPDGCTAFYLNTLTCNYIMASADTQQWLSAIWLNAFQVPVFPTSTTSSSPASCSPSSSFPARNKRSYRLGKVHSKVFHDSAMGKSIPYL